MNMHDVCVCAWIKKNGKKCVHTTEVHFLLPKKYGGRHFFLKRFHKNILHELTISTGSGCSLLHGKNP